MAEEVKHEDPINKINQFVSDLKNLLEKYKKNGLSSDLVKDVDQNVVFQFIKLLDQPELIPDVNKENLRLSKTVCLTEDIYRRCFLKLSETTKINEKISSPNTLLKPYKCSTGKFRIPVAEIINEGKDPREINMDYYFPELDENIFLLEDYIVHNNYKYNLNSLLQYVSALFDSREIAQTQQPQGDFRNIIHYSMMINYEDRDGRLHLVLIASIQGAHSVKTNLKRNYDILGNPVEGMAMLTQIQSAIFSVIHDLDLYTKGDKELPLLPYFPAVSPKGIWKFSEYNFKLSLFYPYFDDWRENMTQNVLKVYSLDKQDCNPEKLKKKHMVVDQTKSLGVIGARTLITEEIFTELIKKDLTVELLQDELNKLDDSYEELYKNDFLDVKARLISIINRGAPEKITEVVEKTISDNHYLLMPMLVQKEINFKNKLREHIIKNTPKGFTEGDPLDHIGVLKDIFRKI